MTHQIFRNINSKYCDNIKQTNIENCQAFWRLELRFLEYRSSTDICLAHFQFISSRPNHPDMKSSELVESIQADGTSFGLSSQHQVNQLRSSPFYLHYPMLCLIGYESHDFLTSKFFQHEILIFWYNQSGQHTTILKQILRFRLLVHLFNPVHKFMCINLNHILFLISWLSNRTQNLLKNVPEDVNGHHLLCRVP